MKFFTDARRQAMLSYSFWAQVLGLFVLIVPEALYGFWGIETNPYFLWWLAVGLLMFGIIGRLMAQTRSAWISLLRIAAVAVLLALLALIAPKVHASTTLDATMRVAIPLVGKWEGKRNHAYLDTIASPPVWTVCYGETRGVKKGDYYTDTQCTAMLRRGLEQFHASLRRYFTVDTIRNRLPATRDAAYLSLAYNAGVAAIGNSTAVRRLNAGDIRGGCEALTWWNKSGGRVVRGLVNRRAEEYRLCLR